MKYKLFLSFLLFFPWMSSSDKLDKETVIDLIDRNQNVSKLNLSDIDLSQKALYDINFFRTNLSQANLSEAIIFFSEFREANLQNANLSKARLKGVNFNKANLENADLSGANLEEVRLTWANLSGADLRGAKLNFVYLMGVLIEGARYDSQTQGLNIHLKSKMIFVEEGNSNKAGLCEKSVLEKKF